MAYNLCLVVLFVTMYFNVYFNQICTLFTLSNEMLMCLLVVTLRVCHTWECISQTWHLLRRGHQTTQKTTWLTFPR